MTLDIGPRPAPVPAVSAVPTYTPAPVPVRDDALLTVRIEPLFSPDGEAVEVLVDQELLVAFVAALARRAARQVRDGHVSRVDPATHDHPDHVACLRCAVIGSTEHRTLAQALLALLAEENTDERWNNLGSCRDTQVISRLKKLAVSAEALAGVYGANWCAVLMTALRAEATNLEQLSLITDDHPDVIPPIDRYTARPEVCVPALAAYHLGTIVAPRTSLRNPDGDHSLVRARLSARLATALFRIAAGETVAWIDRLPEPTL